MDETAREFGLRSSQIKEIAESMFHFAVEVMEEGNKKLLNFSEVRLMKWGVFKVREGRRKHFERINNEKSIRDSKGGS